MMNKMRAEFEAWYATLPLDVLEDCCKWSAWSGWRASRAAIDTLQALDAAGVGYE